MENTRQARDLSVTEAPPGPRLLPPTPLFPPLLPDLSDLESAFLHFTFLPVRREREQGGRT